VYGIKAAVRRLEFAPKLKDMEVTDIENGHFVFRPKPSKPVSLADLQKAITKAGYQIEGTWIEVTGILTPNGLQVPETGQVFHLEGGERLRALREKAGAGKVLAAGSWKLENQQETIMLEEPRSKGGHP
jgi:hypothetical protein